MRRKGLDTSFDIWTEEQINQLEKMFEEDLQEGDEMKTIVWSKDNCAFCIKAKTLLDSKGIQYEERKIGSSWTKEQLLESVPNARSVPQIFLNGEYIGGYTELVNKLQTTKE